MDWGAVDARDVVQALAARFGFDFAVAVDFLLARQLQQQQQEQQQQQHGEDDEDDEEVEDAEQWEDDDDDQEQEDDVIIAMPGQELVTVSMTVGTGEEGFQDGAAAEAMFRAVYGVLRLPDGRVLVVEAGNHRIRMLSADLQQVSTVAGDGEDGHRDGAAAQARFRRPTSLALLPDGRVLVADDYNDRIRMLSADLQDVSTLTVDGVNAASAFELLPDGRVLVAGDRRIRVLEGLVALMGPKPAAKPPKGKMKKNSNNKRALAGGASNCSSSGGGGSSGPALKRGRSGAGPSSAAAVTTTMPSSSSSEDDSSLEEGGSAAAAEAEPLL